MELTTAPTTLQREKTIITVFNVLKKTSISDLRAYSNICDAEFAHNGKMRSDVYYLLDEMRKYYDCKDTGRISLDYLQGHIGNMCNTVENCIKLVEIFGDDKDLAVAKLWGSIKYKDEIIAKLQEKIKELEDTIKSLDLR